MGVLCMISWCDAKPLGFCVCGEWDGGRFTHRSRMSTEQRAASRFIMISSATGGLNVTSSSGICPVSVISLNKVKGKLPSTISDTLLLLHAENPYLSASGNESLDVKRDRLGQLRYVS